MGPLRLGRIRGDRIADMEYYARLRRGGKTSNDTGAPGACRRAFVIPPYRAVGHLAD